MGRRPVLDSNHDDAPVPAVIVYDQQQDPVAAAASNPLREHQVPPTERPDPAPAASGVPTSLLLIRLGFVAVVLGLAVTLVFHGLAVAAVIELILAAGFAGAEIVRRLG